MLFLRTQNQNLPEISQAT